MLNLGQMTPRDAVRVFAERGDLLPSFRWQDVFQDEHARGVAVAGVARLDILNLFQGTLDQAIQEGRGDKWFREAMRGELVAKGWWGDIEITDPETGEVRTTRFDDRRLNLILDTNTRMTHAAARWQRMEQQKARKPLGLYQTMHDGRVSAQHALYDGVCLPLDDPWWNTHYPPCRYRCRCQAFSLDEKELQRRQDAGQTIKRTAPAEPDIEYIHPGTGEVMQVPIGVHPNFAYNPGRAGMRDKGLVDAIKATAPLLPPQVAQVVLADIVRAMPDLAPQLSTPLTPHQFAQGLKDARLEPYEITPAQLHALTDGRLDPQALVRAITGTDQLPPPVMGGENASWMVVMKERNGPGVTVRGHNVPMPGGTATMLTQTFDFNTGTARLDLLELPEAMQGAGVVKRLMSALVPEYQRMGMRRIELIANLDVGGYAWARYGFAPVPKTGTFAYSRGVDPLALLAQQTLPAVARQELADFQSAFDALQDDNRWVRDLLSVDTPALNVILAGVPEYAHMPGGVTLMKALLMGSAWEGMLPFDDALAMRHFWSYVHASTK
ncbi:hypothetical protein VITFI_CDS1532 [Vitreoscilla filiformis]|uniref:Phage head morphogenesis domain-containing protein n=2 Tax=Vitreoscilla filiformis TaxID=63 RepID=A0A221KDD2_VITFI|nr:hypothetical protein VITFI_CDS0112 [Vitreoscilla filiformis]ASM76435.1 hypothetical protein VITFI_CDS0656 [Vitreoscilla filiformis]ASM76840.1 hypothetical protein VITFI_CDS1062 [Vitreoscilla filiformis]ASM77310.1 hypothetical protein VITFI_CDS1532 [Vitreoscilla filiformis]